MNNESQNTNRTLLRLEEKLIELGYELVTNGSIDNVKTYIKNANEKVCHFIQVLDGKIMGVMSELSNEMQQDLEELKNVKDKR